jgi:hypothetical protein
MDRQKSSVQYLIARFALSCAFKRDLKPKRMHNTRKDVNWFMSKLGVIIYVSFTSIYTTI